MNSKYQLVFKNDLQTVSCFTSMKGLSDLFGTAKKQNNQRVDFFFKVKLSMQLLGICLLFI